MRALVADPEHARARRALAACASRGLSVDGVPHGAEALERALADPPALLLCPVHLPMIDGAKLSEILRTNPRTREITFVFLVEDELDVPVGTHPRDRFVVAPWGEEEIAAQVDAALQRNPPLREPPPGEGIEGNLSQVSLLDLLQLFHVNKKNGTVHVDPEGGQGEGSVVLRAGEVVDARIPSASGRPIRGAKALFRLIGCGHGRFAYTPEDPGGPPQIDTPTRALLLEAMRQIDEEERFRQTLPSPGMRVRPTISPGSLPAGTHPLTRDVLMAAVGGATVHDIVDRVPVPDYQVLQTLNALIGRGILEADRQPAPAHVPSKSGVPDGLLDAVTIGRIRDWATTQRPGTVGRIRVPVVATDTSSLEAFAAVLFDAPGVRAPAHQARPEVAVDRLGPIAEFPLGDGLSLLFLALPRDPRFRAVWPVAMHGMIGSIVVHASPLRDSLAGTEEIRAALCEGGRPLAHALLGDCGSSSKEEARGVGGPLISLPRGAGIARCDALRGLVSALVA